MTEPLTFLHPELTTELEAFQPGCQFPHEADAAWAVAWSFPCDCGSSHDLICDGHAGEIRYWNSLVYGRWSCASCGSVGRLSSLVRL